MTKLPLAVLLSLGLGAQTLIACGGGVPITVRIDEATPVVLSIDEAMKALDKGVVDQGVLPGGLRALPEKWPDSLPDVDLKWPLSSPPWKIDLNPEDPAKAKKYEEINKLQSAIERIELNELVLRVEINTSTVPLPELRIEVAADPEADLELRTAWEHIGTIPGAAPREVADLKLAYEPSGESYFNRQLRDEDKDLAVRASGRLRFCTKEKEDTACSRRRPQGAVQLRIIAVVTFFIQPDAWADLYY